MLNEYNIKQKCAVFFVTDGIQFYLQWYNSFISILRERNLRVVHHAAVVILDTEVRHCVIVVLCKVVFCA